ncbi:MAG: efflux transporter outer membrane subunit [Candidatus Omnitrophica bacterium]|nr:efflux transporter outer membrane subunit [Candidatus Omnitrophota bacterium]MDE2222225.1 efflux transporter outer membrane subunit [Candidatus Omnitrophota bacterium]
MNIRPLKVIISTALTFSMAFSGCTFIPKYQRPAPPVPAQFTHANPKVQTAGTPAYDIGWQAFFKDPRLQKLIGLALANNRDYRVAMLNVEQIRDQYRIIRYALIPTFQIDAQGTRERGLVGKSITSLTSYQANINTSYEVDLFGHIRSLQAQAVEQYFATRQAALAARISLVAAVAQQYLTVLAMEEQVRLLRHTLKNVESYYGLITKSYQIGNASALDVRLAEVQVQTIEAAVAGDERLEAQAKDGLMLLVGEALPADLPPSGSLASQRLIEDLPAGLSSDLLQQRPDILEAEHNLKAANANIGVVRAAFFPSITLTASDGTASVKLAKLFEHNVWSFSPQISLPLFNQNTNLANLHAAQVQKKIQIAQYEKTVQTAFKEVSDGLIARDTYNAQLTAQQKLVDAQHERYVLTQARYLNGIDSYLTVLLAQQDLYSARQTLIQVSLDRLTNLINLYKALGGGWKK